MIDGKNIFDQPAKNDQRTYDNIQKVQENINEWIPQPSLYQIMFI